MQTFERSGMKEQLINSAIRLWKENGFDSVSINEICKDCGITKGGFYHYFSSKASLLHDCFLYICDTANNESIKNAVLEESCIEKIWILLEKYDNAAIELGPDLIRIMISNSEEETPDTKDNNISFIDPDTYSLMLAICHRGQETGEIRTDESAEQLIDYLLTSMTGLLLYWGASNKRFDLIDYQKKTLYFTLSK